MWREEGDTTSSGFVLVQVDSHVSHGRQKASKLETSSSGHKREVTNTLQELLTEDYSSVFESSLLSNPWRAVEAYHYFLLVQRLFYSGNFEASLRTVSSLLIVTLIFYPRFSSSRPSSFGIMKISFLQLTFTLCLLSPVQRARRLESVPRSARARARLKLAPGPD